MGLPNAARQTVEAFAAGMGLPAQPARDGSYSFVFARSGTLTLGPDRDGRRVLVSLAAEPRYADRSVQRKAFALAGRDATTGSFLHCGLARDGSIVFALDFAVEAFTEQALDAAIERLKGAHASL